MRWTLKYINVSSASGGYVFDTSGTYVTDDAYMASSCKLEEAYDSAGELTFTIPPCNNAYDDLTPFDTLVFLIKDADTSPCYWAGRVYNVTTDIYGMRTVKCEGALAILNDAYLYQPNNSYVMALDGLVSVMLSLHTQMAPISNATWASSLSVTDHATSKTFGQPFTDTKTTLEHLRTLQETYGGYIYVETSLSGITAYRPTFTLKWVDDYKGTATQTLELGENMVTFSQETDVDDLITRLIPIGRDIADATDSGLYYPRTMTLCSPAGSVDYVDGSSSMIAKYGYICGVKKWPEVEDAATLASLAQSWLDENCKERWKYTATAVDLSAIDSTVAEWRCGHRVRTISAIHDVDDYFIVQKIHNDIFDPRKTKIELCNYKATRANTSRVQARINELNKKVNMAYDALYQAVSSLSSGGGGDYRIWFQYSYPGVLSSEDTSNITVIAHSAAYFNQNITSIEFPNCQIINTWAFNRCTRLQEADFPLCSYVDGSAFNYCTSLTTISFPVCEYIGSGAFFRCTRLQEADFPLCSYVGSSAFNYCTSLTTISFPVCGLLRTDVFRSCYKLQEASFPVCSYIASLVFNSCSNLTTISFPVCEYIGQAAFAGCSKLESATGFSVCSYIGGAAFERCYSLSLIEFPACEYVGNYAFSNCSILKEASLPFCSFIGTMAFVSCRKLESIYLMSAAVVSLSSIAAFYYTPMSDSSYFGYFGSIYVPSSLYSSYIVATNWSVYSSRIVGV